MYVYHIYVYDTCWTQKTWPEQKARAGRGTKSKYRYKYIDI